MSVKSLCSSSNNCRYNDGGHKFTVGALRSSDAPSGKNFHIRKVYLTCLCVCVKFQVSRPTSNSFREMMAPAYWTAWNYSEQQTVFRCTCHRRLKHCTRRSSHCGSPPPHTNARHCCPPVSPRARVCIWTRLFAKQGSKTDRGTDYIQ